MKRFMCILISCLLILNSTLFCYADAGTGLLTVAGGTTLVGAGITGEALAGVASALLPPVAVASALALTAYGANIYISDKAKEEGVTKQTYIENKLLEYAQLEDNAVMTIANGISVTANGVYQWSKDAFNTFSDFVDWLSSDGSIVDSEPVADSSVMTGPISGYPYIDNLTFGTRYGNYTFRLAQGSADDIYMFSSNTYAITFVSLQPFKMYRNSDYLSSSPMTYRSNWQMIQFGTYSSSVNTWPVGITAGSASWETIANSINANGVEYIKATDIPDGAIVSPNLVDIVGVDAASLANGIGNDCIGIGEGVLEGVSVANPAIDGAISVGEYSGVIEGVLEGVGSVSVPSVGSIAIPQGLSIPKPRVIEKEESTPIANNGSLPVAGSLGGGVYTFDLTEIFPFCLPFDLAHLVGKFQGTPTAPHWEIPFKLEGFIDEVIILDFEQFDGVARVFRLGEDVLFIVCLIFISRKMIMS